MDIQKSHELLSKLLSWWIRRHLFVHHLCGMKICVRESFSPINCDDINIFEGSYSVSGLGVFSESLSVSSVVISEVTPDFPSVGVFHLFLDVEKPVSVNRVDTKVSSSVYEGIEFMSRLPMRRRNVVSRLGSREQVVLRWRIANLLRVSAEDVEVLAVFHSIPIGWLKSVIWDSASDVLWIRLFPERKRQELCATLVFYELNGKRGRLFLK